RHACVARVDQLAEAAAQVGRELGREPLRHLRVGSRDLEQLRAEAQCVLDRVKALQDGQRGVAPGRLEALSGRAQVWVGKPRFTPAWCAGSGQRVVTTLPRV